MRNAVTILLVLTILSGRSSAVAAAGERSLPPGMISQAVSHVGAQHASALSQIVPVRPLRKQRAPRLKPILIGAAVGAALLGLAAHSFCEGGSCGGDTAKGMLYGAGWGAAIGFLASTR
jgi:hypothetical protein